MSMPRSVVASKSSRLRKCLGGVAVIHGTSPFRKRAERELLSPALQSSRFIVNVGVRLSPWLDLPRPRWPRRRPRSCRWLLDIGFGDHQRRQQAQHILVGGHGQHVVLIAQPGATSRTGGAILMPASRPLPRSSSTWLGKRCASCCRCQLSFCRSRFDMVEEAGRQHAVEHGIADGRGQRVAAIGRAMRAGAPWIWPPRPWRGRRRAGSRRRCPWRPP
jgi:hypothetical protein